MTGGFVKWIIAKEMITGRTRLIFSISHWGMFYA